MSATHWREFRSSSTSPSELVVPAPPEAAAPAPSRHTIRRRRAALAFVVLAASSFGLGVLAAPSPGPPDKAATLVPANALVYVHASTVPGREQDRRLLALAERFATFRTLRDRAIEAIGPTAGSFDFDRDVRPWLGDEAAFALLPDPLLLAAVRDRAKAEALLTRARAQSVATYRGIGIRSFGASSAAFANGFLLVGADRAVRAAIDRGAGAGARLADEGAYRQAATDRPRGRTLDAYASAAGLHALLPAPLRTLLDDRPGLRALGASLASADGGARVTLRAVGGAHETAEFEPELIDRIPSGAAAYIGLAGGSQLQALVRRAGFGPLVDALRAPAEREAGVDLDRDLLKPLRGELAVAAWSRDGAPVATVLAHTSNPWRTRETMARLQTPIALRLGNPEAPEPFQTRRVGRLDGFVLPATPALQPSYALDEDTLIASSQPAGLARPRSTLADNQDFRRVIGEGRPKAEALVFFDLRQLLALGVLTGALAPGLSADLADLRLVRAAGAVVRREKADTIAELFLEIP